eukprot:106554_1
MALILDTGKETSEDEEELEDASTNMDFKRQCIIEHWMRLSLKIHTYSTDFIPIVIAYSQDGVDPEDIFDIITPFAFCTEPQSDGNVYKGLDRRDGALVAIKITKIECLIMKEVETVKSYESPYLRALNDVYYKDEYAWIVMEYCDGANVSTLMEVTQQGFNEEKLQIIMRHLLKGLKYLHGKHSAYKNVETSKILINTSGYCQWDLSINNWTASDTTESSIYDHKSDIWSLGITVIEMATGKPHSENWSDAFMDFVKLCMIKDCEQRPTAEELLQHEWIKNAGKQSVLRSWMKQLSPLLEQWKCKQLMRDMEDEGSDNNPPTHACPLINPGYNGYESCDATLIDIDPNDLYGLKNRSTNAQADTADEDSDWE